MKIYNFSRNTKYFLYTYFIFGVHVYFIPGALAGFNNENPMT